MDRQRVSSGTDWESRGGYSRAVRAGPHVHVSGTTATDETGAIVGGGDPYEQAKRTIENVEAALEAADAALADVVRTRMYVGDGRAHTREGPLACGFSDLDIDDWDAVGAAHAEAFDDVRPATSMVEVGGLVDPEMLVEMEATAIVGER